ncbi:MAG: OFA family MFS transporter [Betaproteobacteria bacterium]
MTASIDTGVAAPPNRWLIAIMGTVLQLVLGTIYAWSYFQKPLMGYAGWNNQQVAWILSLAICFLGLSAAVGGVLLPRHGPRRLAVTGAVLYAAGWAIGGLALTTRNLPLLYLGLGIIGGIGLGLGYVTPVATAAKWFPDRKGFVTGMVVMGFGFGALLLSKLIGPLLLDFFTSVENGAPAVAWPKVFYGMALVLGVPGAIAALVLRNPPPGYAPPGWRGSPAAAAEQHDEAMTPLQCVKSGRFALMWFVFFCNITAGIMFIGFQSPLVQDLFKARDPGMTAALLAAAGATLIAVSSVFNGIGRFFWGGLSDRIGRIQTFRAILASQVVVFLLMTQVTHPYVFGALVCYVLLCYGGGFGTAPSFVLTVFGSRVMGVVYGGLLTAWAMGGLVGPQIAAIVKDSLKDDPAGAASVIFVVGAGFLAAGLLVSFFLDNRPFSPVRQPLAKVEATPSRELEPAA